MNNRDRCGPLWLVWLVANRVVFKRAISGDISDGAFEIEAIPVEMKPAALSIKTGVIGSRSRLSFSSGGSTAMPRWQI